MKALFGSITALSLRFRYLTLLLTVALMALGVIAWTDLKQELLPPIEFPQTFILAQASGMTSDEVLEILTKRIEAELSTIPEIINLESTTTSTIGAFITAANDFGQNQEKLRASIQTAIDNVWLPKRVLQAPAGEDVVAFTTQLLSELSPETLIYLAEQDDNFLFQLTPAVWAALNDDAAKLALAYLARQVDQTTDAKNALELLVNKEIVPQLGGLADVANVAVSGGQDLPEELSAEATPAPVSEATPESLLLRLSPKVWSVVSARFNLGELNSNAVVTLSSIPHPIPTVAPALSDSWRLTPDGTETRFSTADDILESATLTTPVARVLNNFYTNGRIVSSLTQTNDLTLDDVQRMLAIAPSMAKYFTGEQLVALPADIRELLIANGAVVDAFAQDGLAALQLAEALTGEASVPTPVDLPSQWRIPYPQLISFSFADLPLVTYSVSSTGEIIIPSDETVAPVEAVAENPFADANAPALPPIWAIVAGQFSAQAGTTLTFANAADLLNPALPNGGFPELMNTAIALPQVGDALKPLLASISVDVANYLLEKQPDFFNRMNITALSALSDDVKAIESIDATITYKAVPALPGVWSTLTSQSQFANSPLVNGADVMRLGEGKASTVLNQIHSVLNTDYPDYARRLFNNLSPELVQYWATEEADFYTNLDKAILEDLAPATLEIISQDEAFSAVYDADATAEIIATAVANTPVVVSATEVGPDLNPEWAGIAPFYNLTLDTADDLIYAEPITVFGTISIANAGDLINSFYGNAQGANFAKNILGNMPEEAFNFILENDPTAFDNLIGRAVRDLPANLLGLLSEEVQARATQVEFIPNTQITRTSGNPSLFVTVSKGQESNTVSTFKEVDEIMKALDEADPSITTSVIFEQSTIVEESITGVARDGSLGALFAIIIVLIFLGGSEWGLSGRRITGILLTIGSIIALVVLIGLGLNDAGNDWAQAFSNADPVLRVTLFFGILAGIGITLFKGSMPKPSWRTTLVIAVSIPLSIMIALVGMKWVSPFLHGVFLPLAENEGGLQSFFKFILNLFPEELTLNIMTLSGLTVAVGRVVDDSIVVLENVFNGLKSGTDKKTAIIQGTKEVSGAIFIATLIALVVFLPLGLTGGIIGAFFMPFGLAVTYALIGSFIVAVTVIPILAFFLIGPDDTPDEDQVFWMAKYYTPLLRGALSGPVSKFMIIVGAVLSIGFAGYLFSQRPFAFIPDFGEQQITISVNLDQSTKILTTNELVAEFEAYLEESSPLPEEAVKNIQVTVGGGGQDFASLIGGNSVSENAANISILLDLQPGEADAYIADIRANAERIFGGPDFVTVSAGSASSGGFGGLALVVSGPAEELAPLNSLIIETMNGIEGIANVTSNFVDPNTAGDTPATYIRVNQETAFSYSGELETDNTIGVQQLAVDAIKALPEVANNPNISISRGFNSELQAQGFLSLFSAMGIAILIMIAVLIFSEKSLVYWLAIIFAIVVAPVGAAIGLTLADRVLGIPALTGVLMLFGLVVTTAVVLLERVRTNLIERSMPIKEALVEAGGRRLRPIIMTALTTIIGLVPLAVGLGDGAIIAAELGIVVIGGIISSTILTLFVTPVMFSLLHPIHKVLSFRKDKPASHISEPAGD
ncbi:MAG: efflux RND transporter permease subunit [bacterium]|nr:efflux RND transporter permease subunit [bacterium]